jgi:hypothetical protein
MNKIFTCPMLVGCHVPLYKTRDSFFVGAKNIDEARTYVVEHIENRCKESGLKMVEYFGAIKLEGYMCNDVYYIKEITERNFN